MVGREVSRSVASDFKGDENDIALEVKNVTDYFLHNVSFKVRKGEILGLSGLVGAGRTEMMEFIFGLRKCEKGEIMVNGKVKNIHNPTMAIEANIGFATEDKKRNRSCFGQKHSGKHKLCLSSKKQGFCK